MSRTRVLLLSSLERDVRPDTDLASIVARVLDALGTRPGCAVLHTEVERPADVGRAVKHFRPDAVFNLCETLKGESAHEPVVPMLLEQLGVAFTGSPAHALRTCLRKYDAHEILRAAGVRVPDASRVAPGERAPDGVPLPAIVKPDREDGSLGIDDASVVHTREALDSAVARVGRELGQPAVVEAFVPGRELTVSLLGFPAPRVLPYGEIEYGEVLGARPKILSYAAKWDEASVAYEATRSIAAAAAPALASRLAATGRRAFESLGLRDYGRVDVRLDAQGVPHVIDVNPNCDLSPDGGFMKAAARAGLAYDDAVGAILAGALARAVARAPAPHEPAAGGST